MRLLVRVAAATLAGVVFILIPTTPPRVAPPRRERNLSVKITASPGARPRYLLLPLAVESANVASHAQGNGSAPPGPAAQPVTTAESQAPPALASLVGDVLRRDLEFENAFELRPPGTDGGVAPSARATPADLARWRQLGADGVIAARLREGPSAIEVEARIYKVSTGEEAFARGYEAPAAQARLLAHTVADEILLAQAGIHGIASTRLAFVSDRGGLRRELGGTFRRFKEIWIADYDGANERRVTADGDLDMTPTWSPDGTAIAYTSFKRGFQDIFVSSLGQGRVENPTHGTGKNWLPAWSPDGSLIAFTSVRDGNEEIYAMGRDGSNPRRLTRHPAIDTSPAWSPDGRQIAFTSNRSGSPQIWVMNADGSNPHALTHEKYCDRPTWSPAPYDEIAYVSKTKTGFDIKVIDLASGDTRQLTFGQGFNESPAYAPNGRHIAFSSTHKGGQQIWTISRTGEDLRQVTHVGNNTMPAWSR